MPQSQSLQAVVQDAERDRCERTLGSACRTAREPDRGRGAEPRCKEEGDRIQTRSPPAIAMSALEEPSGQFRLQIAEEKRRETAGDAAGRER